MLIEFAGLPGSGKSSTVHRLTADHSSAKSAGLRRLNERDLIRHPLTVGKQFLRWRSLSSEWTDKRALARILRRRISQDLLITEHGSLLLLDEGITHYMWRILFLYPDIRSEPWGPFLGVDYPLVALDSDRVILQSRISTKAKRGKINEHLVGLGTASLDWDRAEALYEQTLLEASLYRTVVRVDARGDFASTAQQVRDAIPAFGRQ